MEWLALLDADYENLRFAFEWSLEQEMANSSLNCVRPMVVLENSRLLAGGIFLG